MKISNSEIDDAIDTCLGEWQHQVKTAMIIGSVIIHFNKLGLNIGENEIADRIYHLVETGKVVAFGDVKQWRRSEIIGNDF